MKIKQYFQTLQFKLFVLLIVVAVIPVAITAIINQQSTIRLLDVEVKERQTEALQIIVTQVSDFVQSIVIDLESIGQVTHELDLADDLLKQYLISNLTINVDDSDTQLRYDSIWVMDNEGNELSAIIDGRVLSTDALTNRNEDEIFFRAERGEIYYSNVRLIEGSPQISIAVPIIRDEILVGVVAAVINLEKQWEIIRAAQFGASGYAMLLDQRGNLIVHRDPEVINLRVNLASSPAFVSTANSSQETVIQEYYSPISGDVIGNAQLINGPNWILIVERPRSEAFVAEIVATQNAFFSTTLSIIFAVILSIVVARQITRPIVELRDIAYRVQEGDLSLRAKVHSSDEIGQLSTSFNDMAAQLEGLISGLERRVADRTRDLEVAADVSRQVSRVLDMKQLLPYLVDTTRDGFNLAFASIFLYETETNTLRLAVGSGDTGRKMVEQGKQFHLEDKGLVPLAARTFEHQIINDVQASKDHFINPLLPETRSETALPMRVGTRLIGVLDLQANEVDRFSDEQLAVLTTLTDQIAIAIQNAELFAEAEAARETAERSDYVKSSFLASMSHELRTPLNAVINFTKFVAKGDLGPVNEEQEEMLNEVVDSARHLLNLINDVLDMSKIESGSLNLFIEENVDLQSILERAVTTGKSLIGEKSVEIRTDIADDLVTIRADKQRILQICLNIMSNACKFTNEGSIEVRVTQEEEEIIIVFEDSGVGIAEKDQASVFEAFKQTTTGLQQGGGTGLGMPISKNLAEIHGGRLWLESEVDKGTTVFIALPIKSEQLIAVIS